MAEITGKPYRGMSMEGPIATWYAGLTRKDMHEFERLAEELTRGLPKDSRVLEIAPGPGYLAVAMAKRGTYKITGLDISQSFVRMASQYAKKESTSVHFIHGSASDIPLEDGFFDLIICRAAFKNFSAPLQALDEMHRVLKPGGKAIVIDLRADTSWDEISSYVDGLKVSRLSAWMTKLTFKHMLLKRAYTKQAIESLAAQSQFKSADIRENAIGMEIRLVRRSISEQQAA